jgi:hypothetical protein
MATRTPATGRVAHVSHPILLDEMFSGIIAEQLRAKGHDAQAVVTDPALISLPDDQVLARATAAGRALVTANIKDFMPLDAQYRAAGQTHAGLILVSTKTFAQDRTYTTAITSALAALLDKPGQIQDGHVLFLTRH